MLRTAYRILIWNILLHLHSFIYTYSMEQSPSWETDQFLASQIIPRILWNWKVHYHTHEGPPPVPILSQLHPVPTTPSHFLKIHLNIILPTMSWSSHLHLCLPSGLCSSYFPTKTLYTPHLSPIHAVCPAHLILLDLITWIIFWWGVQIIKLLIM